MNFHFSAGSQQGTDPLPVEAGIHNSEELNRIFLKKKSAAASKHERAGLQRSTHIESNYIFDI